MSEELSARKKKREYARCQKYCSAPSESRENIVQCNSGRVGYGDGVVMLLNKFYGGQSFEFLLEPQVWML